MKLIIRLSVVGILVMVFISMNVHNQPVNAQRTSVPYFTSYNWSLNGCDSGDITFTGQAILGPRSTMTSTSRFRISTLALESVEPMYSMGRAHSYFVASAGSSSIRNLNITLVDADDWSFQIPNNPDIEDSVFPYRSGGFPFGRPWSDGGDAAYVSIWNMTQGGCASALVIFSCHNGEVDFVDETSLCMGGPE